MQKFLAVLPGVCLLICCLARPSLGQSVDVHITPRKAPVNRADATSSLGGVADPDRTHGKPLRKNVDLVLVPVTIRDGMDRFVAGLDKDRFLLAENGQPQQIRSFSTDDAPISLGVIFDLSGSMKDKIDQSRKAVLEFFRSANPPDEFFLVTFSDRPELLVNFTSSIDEIQNSLPEATPRGATSLLDAIYLGISRMGKARYERRALLIISDGGDNRSRYTESEIDDMVRESDIQIYAMGLFNFHGKTREEMHGPELLAGITDATGGQTYFIKSPRDLPDVAAKIGIDLRNQYVLGYHPSNPTHDGKWRKIKVKVNPPEGSPRLHVYAKSGYYAASE